MAGALSLSQTDPSESLDQVPQLLEKLAPRDDSSKWLAFTAGMGAPTKTGALSEALGNAATMQLEQRNQHDRLKAAYMPLIANVFEAQQKAKQAQELNKMLADFMGPSVSPGAYAPAADGYGPTMPAPQAGSRLASMTPDQVAMLKLRGLDLSDMYKWARDPQKMEQGATYVDKTTGETKFMPKVPEGARPTASGGIEAVPGLFPFLSQQTLATKLPEAVVSSASRVNLRKLPDGTEVPVVELSENPLLNDYLASQTGTVGVVPPRRPAARVSMAEPPPQAGVTASPGAILNDPALEAAINDIKDPQERANARAALMGNAAPSGARPGAYGKTTEQATAEEVEKASRLASAKLPAEAQDKINQTWLKTGYEPTVESGKAASDMLSNVQVARQSLRNLGNTGWGTEAKALGANMLAGLGLAPEQAKTFAANAQTFQSAAMSNLWTRLNAAKGPQTEGDADRASKTWAALKNTPQANEFILDFAEANAMRDQMKARFYEQALPIAQKKGDLQEVDREWSKRAPSVFNLPSMQKWAKK